jgi:ribosomal-protein-serine acetyltransferase
MFNQPLLTDKVVALRRFHPRDVDAFHAAVNESLGELIPWMSWAHPAYSRDEVAEYIRIVGDSWDAGRYYAFAITDARDGTMLGAASLSHIHPVYNFCNLGYWIRTSHRGNGLAARAARLTAKFGFEQLGLIRVEVVIAVGNEASLKVAEKSGAHREGILRDRVTVREQIHDAVMFSFVRADFGLPPYNGGGIH